MGSEELAGWFAGFTEWNASGIKDDGKGEKAAKVIMGSGCGSRVTSCWFEVDAGG